MDENVLWISCATKNILRREERFYDFFDGKSVEKHIVFL